VYVTATAQNGLYTITSPTSKANLAKSKARVDKPDSKAISHSKAKVQNLDSKAESKADSKAHRELVYEVHRKLGHLNIGTMARMARSGQIQGLKRISTDAFDRAKGNVDHRLQTPANVLQHR
jgi:hypothetical protein